MGPGPVVQHVGGQDGSWLSCFPFLGCDFFCFSLLVVGGPTMTGKAGLVAWKRLYIKQLLPTTSAVAEPLPWPFGLHVAGYQIQDYTHPPATQSTAHSLINRNQLQSLAHQSVNLLPVPYWQWPRTYRETIGRTESFGPQSTSLLQVSL